MKKLQEDCNAGGAELIGVVIATLVAIIVGVMIWYKTNAGIFGAAVSTYGINATTMPKLMRSAFNSTNATANTVWTLFPIVCIVLIAGVILAIVTNFGRGGGA